MGEKGGGGKDGYSSESLGSNELLFIQLNSTDHMLRHKGLANAVQPISDLWQPHDRSDSF